MIKDIKTKYDIVKKRKLYLFCGLWFLVALLQFAQDYLSSVLNNTHFELFESLSYKLFWPLCIPFTMLMIYGLKRIKVNNRILQYLTYGFNIIVTSTLHLIAFSIILFLTSQIIHDEDTWRLSWLLKEKFSNYLYIALSIYLVTMLAYFWIKQRETAMRQKKYAKAITVKNGRKSIIVNVNDIKFISSDGPYIFLYTLGKNYIVSDSLKNILTKLPQNFKRIHRSTIVNIDMVKELKSRMNGDYDVVLKDNQTLRLSRTYSKSLKGILL